MTSMMDKLQDRKPKAFRDDLWNDVHPDDRPEVLSRASYLVMRGGITSNMALVLARDGMDLDIREAERHASWATIHPISLYWPPPVRTPAGRIKPAIIALAAVTEELASAELEAGGQREIAVEQLERLAPNEKVAKVAIREFLKMAGLPLIEAEATGEPGDPWDNPEPPIEAIPFGPMSDDDVQLT
ncbi:hypothetical protein [Bosea sp. RAC05]|uniref:hypothetical protein n=1 Tax=Bosea sp. RAC05 TaxID=1842539 RepID=UPI00083DAC7E|nr:hypothetical protein [Bosea sp. RAC05]AOG03186.1 hypothetical protein BSY19_4953 [Bosea sp. RAC05]